MASAGRPATSPACARGCCPPRGSWRSFPRPHQINSGLCDRLLSAFHIGGADLRIIRTADSVHAIAAHVAAGTGIGITVESALGHQPPGLRVIPLTGPSTTADQVVLTPAKPSPAATALRDLLLQTSAEQPSSDH